MQKKMARAVPSSANSPKSPITPNSFKKSVPRTVRNKKKAASQQDALQWENGRRLDLACCFRLGKKKLRRPHPRSTPSQLPSFPNHLSESPCARDPVSPGLYTDRQVLQAENALYPIRTLSPPRPPGLRTPLSFHSAFAALRHPSTAPRSAAHRAAMLSSTQRAKRRRRDGPRRPPRVPAPRASPRTPRLLVPRETGKSDQRPPRTVVHGGRRTHSAALDRLVHRGRTWSSPARLDEFRAAP